MSKASLLVPDLTGLSSDKAVAPGGEDHSRRVLAEIRGLFGVRDEELVQRVRELLSQVEENRSQADKVISPLMDVLRDFDLVPANRNILSASDVTAVKTQLAAVSELLTQMKGAYQKGRWGLHGRLTLAYRKFMALDLPRKRHWDRLIPPELRGR